MRKKQTKPAGLSSGPPKVMVAIGVGFGYGRDMVAGIVSYARANGPWEFVGQISLVAEAEAIRRAPDYDGLIFHYTDDTLVQAAAARDVPSVSVGGNEPLADIPHIAADSEAIAEMAFTHMAELGFKRYAVYGGNSPFRDERLGAFSRLAESADFACVDLGRGSRIGWNNASRNRQWAREVTKLKQKLARVRSRMAVFTWSTEDARPVMAACAELGIDVPDQIAVLGVDDDEAICELASPAISAIDHGCETIGWEAARTLDFLMRGEGRAEPVTRVPPVRVVVRQSTDTLAIDDPLVVRALRFIRSRVDDGISVEDVLDEMDVSRPTLEQHFKRTVGRTVHRQIILARIDRAKELLQATDLELGAISVRCGFSYPSKFSTIFRREVGSSPSDYRINHRMHKGA